MAKTSSSPSILQVFCVNELLELDGKNAFYIMQKTLQEHISTYARSGPTRVGGELSSDSRARNNTLKPMSDTEIRKLSPYKQTSSNYQGQACQHNLPVTIPIQPASPIMVTLQAKLVPTVDLISVWNSLSQDNKSVNCSHHQNPFCLIEHIGAIHKAINGRPDHSWIKGVRSF